MRTREKLTALETKVSALENHLGMAAPEVNEAEAGQASKT
jgi:BMFP domain-containing protein YqiC